MLVHEVNVPFTLSVTASILGLLVAWFSWFIARAPGLSQLRPFSLCCVCGALYAACNAAMLSPISPEAGLWMTRMSILLAGCHGASWFFYRAEREQRKLTRGETFLVGGGLLFGAMGLVPDLIYIRPKALTIEWLGVVYQDGEPTTLGGMCFAYFAMSMLVPLRAGVRGLLKGDRSELADVIGLSMLLATGVHDSFVSTGSLPMPYLLDLGYLCLIVAVSASLARRFLATTVDLAEARATLLARERLAALGEMSAVVAHEVRNPVGVIFNALATIKKGPAADPTQRDLLAIVEEEAHRLKRMVTNLLDFAKPRRVSVSAVDAHALLHGVADGTRAAGSPEDDVVVEVSPTLVIPCDPELMRQALMNLVTNALQAEGRRSPVLLRAHVEDQRIALEVIDDGAGIADGDERRVFEPFFTTRPTGVGLGLPVVSRVVEAHGGELRYRKTLGGGSTFDIRLPIHAKQTRADG